MSEHEFSALIAKMKNEVADCQRMLEDCRIALNKNLNLEKELRKERARNAHLKAVNKALRDRHDLPADRIAAVEALEERAEIGTYLMSEIRAVCEANGEPMDATPPMFYPEALFNVWAKRCVSHNREAFKRILIYERHGFITEQQAAELIGAALDYLPTLRTELLKPVENGSCCYCCKGTLRRVVLPSLPVSRMVTRTIVNVPYLKCDACGAFEESELSRGEIDRQWNEQEQGGVEPHG